MLFYIRAPVPGDDPYDHEAIGARLGFWIAVLPLVVGTLLALVLMWLPTNQQAVNDTQSTAPIAADVNLRPQADAGTFSHRIELH